MAMAKYLKLSDNPKLKVISQHEIGKPEQKYIIELKNHFLQQKNIKNQIDKKEQSDNPATKIAKKLRSQYGKSTRTVLEEELNELRWNWLIYLQLEFNELSTKRDITIGYRKDDISCPRSRLDHPATINVL